MKRNRNRSRGEAGAGEWALSAAGKPASKGLWGHLGIRNISYTITSVEIAISVCCKLHVDSDVISMISCGGQLYAYFVRQPVGKVCRGSEFAAQVAAPIQTRMNRSATHVPGIHHGVFFLLLRDGQGNQLPADAA